MFLKVFLLLITAAGATTTCPRCHHPLQAKKKVDKVSQKSWMMFPAPKPQSFTGTDSRGPYRCWPLNPQPRSKTEEALSSLALNPESQRCEFYAEAVGVTESQRTPGEGSSGQCALPPKGSCLPDAGLGRSAQSSLCLLAPTGAMWVGAGSWGKNASHPKPKSALRCFKHWSI